MTDFSALSKVLKTVAKSEGVELSPAEVKHLAESILAPRDKARVAAHVRPARKAHARFAKAGVAAQAIDGFDHGMDVMALTYGQFSLIDLIQATLDKTGPADVTVATWSSGFYDLEAAKNFCDDGRVRSIRFVMDSGREKKGQAGAVTVAELFGEESIITVRTHAKFVLIRNEEWDVCITSSMNLNKNIRCEQFEMTDDAARCDMFEEFVGAAFREAPPSRSFGRVMPALSTVDPDRTVVALPSVSRNTGSIRMGRVSLARDAG
ncbi:hypothetical protein NG01_04360 [Corynebacterium diphtheriae]|uniref:hypothetical protein n=1 Tax=Corynebacterium diphtheriae TaxID=1717 RepID=UPI0005EB0484|nr:hypothetical protein [Corynebacterium diphtheriae]KJJ60018.1 hypothetical protein NG01_04360 [Corynebacterium diphtheriae]